MIVRKYGWVGSAGNYGPGCEVEVTTHPRAVSRAAHVREACDAGRRIDWSARGEVGHSELRPQRRAERERDDEASNHCTVHWYAPLPALTASARAMVRIASSFIAPPVM